MWILYVVSNYELLPTLMEIALTIPEGLQKLEMYWKRVIILWVQCTTINILKNNDVILCVSYIVSIFNCAIIPWEEILSY